MNSLDQKLMARLVSLGFLSDAQGARAAEFADEHKMSFARAVVHLDLAKEKVVTKHLARLSGFDFLDLSDFEPDPLILRHMRASWARRFLAMPVGIVGDTLVVAIANGEDIIGHDNLRALIGRPVQLVLATETALQGAIDRHYDYDETPAQVPTLSATGDPSEGDGPEPSEHPMKPENMSMVGERPRPPAPLRPPLPFTFEPRQERDIHVAPTAMPEDMPEEDAGDGSGSAGPGGNSFHSRTTVCVDADEGMTRHDIAAQDTMNDDDGVDSMETLRLKPRRPAADDEKVTIVESHASDRPPGVSINSAETQLPGDELHPPARSNDMNARPTIEIDMAEVSTLLIEPAPHPDELDGPASDASDLRRRTPDEVRLPDGSVRTDSDSGLESASDLLKHMIDDALAARAEELEYAPPSAEQTRSRIRKRGVWRDLMPYPVRYHEPMMGTLRRMAGIDRREEKPVEVHFTLDGKRGKVPVVAMFTPTMRGDRCVLRFPENLPLLQRPLRSLGVSPEVQEEFDRRLSGSGGGLLLLTAENTRLTQQLFASILHEKANEGRSVVSLDWTMDRSLPNVTQVHCPTAESLREHLLHVATETPDLVGVSLIPSADSLRDVLETALKGLPVVACFTAPSPELSLAVYDAAGIDPVQRSLGVLAHIHLSQVPRLCGRCREAMGPSPKRLPEWALPLEGKRLYEAKGCEECGQTGRKGTSWLPEAFVPDPANPGTFQTLRSRADSLRQLALEAWLDPRDVR